MGTSQVLRTAYRWDNIVYTPGGPFSFPTYLWTVYFTIGGLEAYVDDSNLKNIHLAGGAVVVGSPGNHGDLGDPGNSAKAGTIPIPSDIGEYRIGLLPIPLKSDPNVVYPYSVFGCLVLLMGQEDTPSDAVYAGYLTLRTALATALNDLIPTLSGMKRQPSIA
jgi:hypothetical protein